jgi:mannose-6-phosphate isomerase-like protein (cupin superfamily)
MFWKESDATDIQAIPAIHGGDGTIRVRRFFKDQSRTGVHFQIWELAPGASEGNHIHTGDDDGFEEIYYFLQGQGMMWVDGAELPIVAGDAFLVPPGVDHGFRNTGSDPLRLVLLFGKPRE